MKKLIFLLLLSALMFSMLSGCTSSLPVTEAQVKDAITVAIEAYVNGGLAALTGSASGVDYNTATLQVTFSGYDVSSYGEGLYTAITGSAIPRTTDWLFDVTLTGGPVETLYFAAESLDQAVTIEATANSQSFSITVE